MRQLYKDTCSLDVSYGKEPLQKLDLFPSSQPNAPVLVFIHGGYWRSLDKSSYSFVAERFVQANITVAVINYRLIPTVDMEHLLQDVYDGVQWIQQNVDGGDQMALCGHSAGGHLALMTYLRNPTLQPNIRAICSLSGIFDLEPIRNSYLSDETLQLTQQDVEKFSVTNTDLAATVACPTMIAVGGGETKFFVDESKQICSLQPSFLYHEYDKLNHYQIVHQLGAFESDDVMVPFLLTHLQGEAIKTS